ncbi:MAG: hypothetical protein PHT95_04910 [Candidatus Omnitrophica bacterium]|nr:hypothetical protein [Candidatus Omnitrophota bacterium]
MSIPDEDAGDLDGPIQRANPSPTRKTAPIIGNNTRSDGSNRRPNFQRKKSAIHEAKEPKKQPSDNVSTSPMRRPDKREKSLARATPIISM